SPHLIETVTLDQLNHDLPIFEMFLSDAYQQAAHLLHVASPMFALLPGFSHDQSHVLLPAPLHGFALRPWLWQPPPALGCAAPPRTAAPRLAFQTRQLSSPITYSSFILCCISLSPIDAVDVIAPASANAPSGMMPCHNGSA